MSNVLTALIPTLFKTVNMVMREQVGFIPSVSRDFSPEQMNLAVGQTMKIPLSISQALGAYTPAMTTTVGTSKTPTAAELTIANNSETSFNLTNEEEQLLINGGNLPGFREQQIAEGFRVFCNQIESDISSALDLKFSRAYGTAATTPFGSNIADVNQMKKILKDNGAWVPGQMALVLDTAAELNLSNLTQLSNANQAGTDEMLRQGIITRLGGFDIRVSNGIGIHTAGTASGATINAAGSAKNAVNIPTAAAGTGTILPGDVIGLANDTGNKYGVITGAADVSGALSTMYIGAPGLMKATGASARAITVTADHTTNFAFNRNAVLLFARPPIIKKTAILDTIQVTDPVSGLSFLVCEIQGDGITTYRINLAWGISVIKSNGVAKLIG